MKKLGTGFLLFTLSLGASAYTFKECNNMDMEDADNVTLSECSITLKKGYDSQVNSFIQKIKNDPKADAKLKKNLISSQKQFEIYKDEQCSYFFESTQDAPDGSGLITQAFCEAGMSRQRLDFLKNSFD